MGRLILIAVLFAVGGCQSIQTTRSLGALQAEYGDLVRTEQDCTTGALSGDICLGDFQAMYGFVESQADAAIKARPSQQTLTEQQITIALHRLAAFAALKSGSGQAATYGAAGKVLCDNVQHKPPRDCALLEVVGQLEVVNAYSADVACLRQGASGCARGFETLAGEFCSKVLKPLQTRTDAAKNTFLLPDQVVAYLDAQPSLAVDNLDALAEELTSGMSLADKPSKPCDCVTLDPGSSEFARDCGNVAREPMATFKAECVRRSLSRSSDCPTF